MSGTQKQRTNGPRQRKVPFVKVLAKQSRYRLDRERNVWLNPSFEGIAYNDGDEVETRIASIIKNAADISVLSTELRRQCTDWPSLYHLNGTRANILRPFEQILKGDILEIGAGCGALTRYLGECGANVLALEGSPRRAAIARSRTRDLENVTVIAEKLDQFQWDHQFHVVTLVGILEYANLFTPGDNPALALLQQARRLLKPDGVLIVAIENQLGLKYFAGAPEDHLGQPMVGIEGRYRQSQPQTYGRAVLLGLLKHAGFPKPELLAPFPDYKLPISIVTESGFAHRDFDAAALAWQYTRQDPQLPELCTFSLELAWPEVFKNGIARDLANSLLFVASPASRTVISPDILAYHFSTDRVPAYCKQTVFTKVRGKNILVRYRRLGNAPPWDRAYQKGTLPIEFSCPAKDSYARGHSLAAELMNILTTDGWSVDHVAHFIQRYLSMIDGFARAEGIERSFSSPYETLPGRYFDVIPQNIIIGRNDKPILIDKEWQLAQPIELGHLVLRFLLHIIPTLSRFGCSSSGITTRNQLIVQAIAASGLTLQEEDCRRYVALESEVQQVVTGYGAERFARWWSQDSLLPTRTMMQVLAQRDSHIVQLNETIGDRDLRLQESARQSAEAEARLADLQEVVTKRDAHIAGLDQALAEDRQRLASLTESLALHDAEFVDLHDLLHQRDLRINDFALALAERESRIAALHHTIDERDARLNAQSDVAGERDRRIEALNEAIGQRDRQLSALASEITSRDHRIEALNGAIGERDQRMRDLVREIGERILRISGLSAALNEREQRLTTMARTLAEDQARHTLNEARVAQDQARIADLSEALEERDKWIAAYVSVLADRDQRLDELSAHLRTQQDHVLALQQRNAAFESRIAELGMHNEHHQASLQAERAATAERDAQIAHLRQALAQRETLLSGVLSSHSWRFGRPLRAVKSLFSRTPASQAAAQDETPIFNGEWYLKRYPDVAKSGMDPHEHYVTFGQKEGRKPAPDPFLVRCVKALKYTVTLRFLFGAKVHPGTLISLHSNDYGEWIRCYDTITDELRDHMARQIAAFPAKPLISLVMPTYNTKKEWLEEAIASVQKQIYPHWELCIADDASTAPHVRAILERYAAQDPRIKVAFRVTNGSVSAASNCALELAQGEYIALLDHDDLLTEHALFWVAATVLRHPKARLLYSDEDKIDHNGVRTDPYFKCDFNPDLFYSHNMISHLGVYHADLIKNQGGFRQGVEGAQDYDLALRCLERLNSDEIVHIPRVLYHWRVHLQSTASSGWAKPYALIAGERALNDHFQRRNIMGHAELLSTGVYRVRYPLPNPQPLVSLIIPTRNSLKLIRQCIKSIVKKTSYTNYEIVIVDNGSDDAQTLEYFKSLAANPRVRILRDERPFSFSALNNAAVKHARGELVGLINNDIEVISPDWLSEMASHALRPGVGAVGARLWYPDKRLQHGGVILGLGGVAGHSHKYLLHKHRGYFGRAELIQTLSAVTAACLIIRKSIYEGVGGLNEALPIAFNDVDFCLRVREAGYRNVWTPYAELYHHESASRGFEDTPQKQARFTGEVRYMQKRWGPLLLNDPAYSPNLTINLEDFSLAWPPRVDE